MNYREENLILIVDTNRAFCDSTSRYLLEAGYKTVVAYDGIQAQILLNELIPHLVLLDIEIPGKDALDIVNQACRMGFTIPVIMTAIQSSRVSGLPMEQKGVVDFVVKPLNCEVFLRKIKNDLQKAKTARDNTLSSVQQKLDDLSLISSYSEKLLPLVDENEVIRCLFTTVQKYFNLDVVGVLIARKRNHVFLYWSKGQAAETAIRKICSEIIEEYNRAARTKVSLKRVVFKQFLPSVAAATCIDAAPPFRHIVALVGEAFDYGAMYFGSCLNGAEFQGRLALLSSIASQTRIALTNSKLYNDMKE
ncbi:MAG TPA: response regulator, partial [Chitinivibrionales bacterium]